MRRSPSSAITVALTLCLALPAEAQDPVSATGASFLLVPVGARAAALGQAAVADGGSTESVFWNPAGLAHLRESELAIHHARTFASNNTVLAAYLQHDRLGVIGVSGYLVDFGTQPIIPPGGGDPVGRFGPKGLELLATYATTIAGPMALGVTYKLVQFRQDCQGACGGIPTVSGTTHAIDLGVQYAAGATRDLAIGLAVRHVGFKLQLENSDQADPLPTRLQLGVAYRIYLPGSLPEGERLDARLLFDLQQPWDDLGNPEPLVGLELGFRELVRLRTGYALVASSARGPSIGIGVQYERVAVDFARVFFTSGTVDEPAYLSVRLAL